MRGTLSSLRRSAVGSAALLAAAFIAGCSLLPPRLPTDAAEATPVTDADSPRKPEVFYTANAGVKLYAAPGFGSELLAELPRHQKVYRRGLTRGFAQVEVDGTGQVGWVENATLIWKIKTREAREAPPAAAADRRAEPEEEHQQARPAADALPAEGAPAPADRSNAPDSTESNEDYEARPAVFDSF